MTVLKNVKWITLAQISKVIIQLLSLTILTRLVTPEQYGVMAMALIVTNFALIFRDLGTSAAIIQKKDLSAEIVSSVFWLNVIMGGAICIVIAFSAPMISTIFRQPQLTDILILISISFPIASLGSVHQALLERDSNFKLVSTIEILSAISGLVIAIVFAYKGAGVYSLVVQTITTCIISTVSYWLVSKFKPIFSISRKELRGLVSFSGNLTLFNLINYFSRNADGMIIGRKFSSIVLGSYSLSYRLMLFPIQSLSIIAARSLYPVMSRKQDDLVEIKIMFFKTLTIIASLTAPMMFGLVMIRESFVAVAFGSNWALVPALLMWMAPTGFIQSLLSVTGSVLVARGKTALQLYLGLFSSCLSISAFIIGSQFSIIMLAKFYLISNIISGVISLNISVRSIKASFTELMKKLSAPVCSTAIMLIVLFFARLLLRKFYPIDRFPIFDILFSVIVGGGAYITSYRLLFNNTLAEIAPSSIKRLLKI